MQGSFPDLSWDSGEGWEEAVHMPTSVAYVAEENFSFVAGALAHFALGIFGGGAAVGIGGGWYGCGRGSCLRKWD